MQVISVLGWGGGGTKIKARLSHLASRDLRLHVLLSVKSLLRVMSTDCLTRGQPWPGEKRVSPVRKLPVYWGDRQGRPQFLFPRLRTCLL